jgi:hypothetical protein
MAFPYWNIPWFGAFEISSKSCQISSMLEFCVLRGHTGKRAWNMMCWAIQEDLVQASTILALVCKLVHGY